VSDVLLLFHVYVLTLADKMVSLNFKQIF
jgi:hypothetical protein